MYTVLTAAGFNKQGMLDAAKEAVGRFRIGGEYNSQVLYSVQVDHTRDRTERAAFVDIRAYPAVPSHWPILLELSGPMRSAGSVVMSIELKAEDRAQTAEILMNTLVNYQHKLIESPFGVVDDHEWERELINPNVLQTIRFQVRA